MKFLMLIYGNPTEWKHPVFMYADAGIPKDELDRLNEAQDAFVAELIASGEIVGGRPLTAPATSKTVRRRGGRLAITDGPFAETKEQLAGYVVLECPNIERALEIAARYPDAETGALEVREILDILDLEV